MRERSGRRGEIERRGSDEGGELGTERRGGNRERGVGMGRTKGGVCGGGEEKGKGFKEKGGTGRKKGRKV